MPKLIFHNGEGDDYLSERTFVATYEEAVIARGTAEEMEEALKALVGMRGIDYSCFYDYNALNHQFGTKAGAQICHVSKT